MGEISVDPNGEAEFFEYIRENLSDMDLMVACGDSGTLSEEEVQWLNDMGMTIAPGTHNGIWVLERGIITKSVLGLDVEETQRFKEEVSMKVDESGQAEISMNGKQVAELPTGVEVWIYDRDFEMSTYLVSINEGILHSIEISTFLRGVA